MNETNTYNNNYIIPLSDDEARLLVAGASFYDHMKVQLRRSSTTKRGISQIVHLIVGVAIGMIYEMGSVYNELKIILGYNKKLRNKMIISVVLRVTTISSICLAAAGIYIGSIHLFSIFALVTVALITFRSLYHFFELGYTNDRIHANGVY